MKRLQVICKGDGARILIRMRFFCANFSFANSLAKIKLASMIERRALVFKFCSEDIEMINLLIDQKYFLLIFYLLSI